MDEAAYYCSHDVASLVSCESSSGNSRPLDLHLQALSYSLSSSLSADLPPARRPSPPPSQRRLRLSPQRGGGCASTTSWWTNSPWETLPWRLNALEAATKPSLAMVCVLGPVFSKL